jgi:hypothetical protein
MLDRPNSRIHKYYIKTDSHLTIFSMGRKEILSCFYDTALLFLIDPVLEILDSVKGPGFDLDKDDGFAIQGDKIHFPPGGTEIPGYYPETGILQGPGGQIFPFPALPNAMHALSGIPFGSRRG